MASTTANTAPCEAATADKILNGSTFPHDDEKDDHERNIDHDDNDDNDDDDAIIAAFTSVDFTGVNFEDTPPSSKEEEEEDNEKVIVNISDDDHSSKKTELQQQQQQQLLSWEEDVAFHDFGWLKQSRSDDANHDSTSHDVHALGRDIATGKYVNVLKNSNVAKQLFQQQQQQQPDDEDISYTASEASRNRIIGISDCISNRVQKMIEHKGGGAEDYVLGCMLQLEFLAIAALCLYLQANYTGPSLRPEHHPNTSTSTSTSMMNDLLDGINPHACFLDAKNAVTVSSSSSNDNDKTATPRTTNQNHHSKRDDRDFHNLVLSELAVDGEWPCPICQVPYFLLLARCILSALVNYQKNNDHKQSDKLQPKAVYLWHARALLAQYRLLQVSHAGDCVTLCQAMDQALDRCTTLYCPGALENDDEENDNDDDKNSSKNNSTINVRAATVLLERGLTEFHLNRSSNYNSGECIQSPLHYIRLAQRYAGLHVSVTGAMGKRTKFQQQATAQMLVRTTKTAASNKEDTPVEDDDNEEVEEENEEKNVASAAYRTAGTVTDKKSLLVQHAEDEILLERIKFEDDEENDENQNNKNDLFLSPLDQCILLALCLNVKENNPTISQHDGGLTGEEMGAYLARVLDHYHEQQQQQQQNDKSNTSKEASVDWMIYATALLERSWLEFERSHAKERALLQLQALLDQHTNRLTITQSTMASVDTESAPVQKRVQNIHSIIYPPQWSLMDDLATRYATMGLVTTAAEIYTEIEAWDDVVECYARAGKQHLAQEIVEERLQQGHETPRMWTALGDLTRNPEHYQRAIDLSKGRYSRAYIALGLYHFEHVNKQRTPPIAAIAEGDEQQQQDGQQEPQPQPTNHLELALSNYQAALAIRPLNAAVWFRVGTICMQLKQWEKALQAFSNVVQQEPEAAEAWANVAAIHMHNRQPAEAYPALVESLKHARHNWRVWVSKLYTCLDLSKYDEAIQACQVILDLQSSRPSENIPPPEEKCIRAIVAGTVRIFHEKSVNTTTNGNAGVHDSSSEQNGQQQHEAGLGSARRTLSRVHALLDRMASLAQSSSSSSSSSSQQQQQQQQSWIFQLLAAFHEQISQDNDKVLEYLMQDYRSLQDVKGWELDNHQVQKMCSVVSHICDIRRQPSQPQQEKQQQQRKEGLVKARMLVRGVVKKIRAARTDDGYFPDNVNRLEELLVEIENELAEQNVQ